jgi:hypothetical protein
MFGTGGMIDHLIQDVVLVLSITFMVPLIGAIAGTIVTNLAAPHRDKERIGYPLGSHEEI